MKKQILLTNDDGILAEGLFTAYEQLKKLGDVTIVAPDRQRSSVGQAITLQDPLRVKEVKFAGKFFGYAINGYPTDCVKYATSEIFKKQKPDLVVSGINLGANEGCSIYYSGTVGAAREGALQKIPAIAASLNTFTNPDYSAAAEYTYQLAKIVLTQSDFPRGTLLNLNVPAVSSINIEGVRWTRRGLDPIRGVFKKLKDPNGDEYLWMAGKPPLKKGASQTDIHALSKNFVTITPIQTDSTNYAFLEKMKQVSKLKTTK